MKHCQGNWSAYRFATLCYTFHTCNKSSVISRSSSIRALQFKTYHDLSIVFTRLWISSAGNASFFSGKTITIADIRRMKNVHAQVSSYRKNYQDLSIIFPRETVYTGEQTMNIRSSARGIFRTSCSRWWTTMRLLFRAVSFSLALPRRPRIDGFDGRAIEWWIPLD